jgi:asparagine N-glycosylation enzyme membrane subunit Stt3
LFLAAFAFNISPHEAVHAIVAYVLGFNSTLFQMWVNPEAAEASSSQVAAIAGAGPIFSLVIGVIGCLAYLRYKRRPSGLFFVMFGLVGIYSFLGPTAVAGFGGDFHTALQAAGVSKGIQYAASIGGIVLLATFMFLMGRELSLWAPPELGRVKTVICTTLAPWLIGTILVLLIYWPLPGFLVSSSISGSVFWVFAVIGAALAAERTTRERSWIVPILRSDLIITGLAVGMVRVLAHGIHIAH